MTERSVPQMREVLNPQECGGAVSEDFANRNAAGALSPAQPAVSAFRPFCKRGTTTPVVAFHNSGPILASSPRCLGVPALIAPWDNFRWVALPSQAGTLGWWKCTLRT